MWYICDIWKNINIKYYCIFIILLITFISFENNLFMTIKILLMPPSKNQMFIYEFVLYHWFSLSLNVICFSTKFFSIVACYSDRYYLVDLFYWILFNWTDYISLQITDMDRISHWEYNSYWCDISVIYGKIGYDHLKNNMPWLRRYIYTMSLYRYGKIHLRNNLFISNYV